MRIGVVIGVVLVALGGYMASGNASYKTKQDVMRVGELRASVQEEHRVPAWVGFVTLGAGVLVLVGSLRKGS